MKPADSLPFPPRIEHISPEDLVAIAQGQEIRKRNPVIQVTENVRKYILEFEARLDPEHEIGLRIASFGDVVFFHAESIGFAKPDLVTFIGVTAEGERVQLVQHYSQLSFLLKAVKKQQPEARRIGFF